jgi:hypothetical protein
MVDRVRGLDRHVPVVLICAALLGSAGCATSAEPGGSRTVTVTRPAPATPSGSSPTPAATTPGPAPTRRQSRLPGNCTSSLPVASVENAIGRDVPGNTSFVVGAAEADIDRLGYLNCRYGLPGGPAARTATPAIEIGVSLYGSAAAAAKRIPVTVDDFENHGAGESPTTVGALPATVLTGGEGDGYDVPTLVLASGQRTVAVSIVPRSGADVTHELVAVAALALKHTAG